MYIGNERNMQTP